MKVQNYVYSMFKKFKYVCSMPEKLIGKTFLCICVPAEHSRWMLAAGVVHEGPGALYAMDMDVVSVCADTTTAELS